MSDPVCLWCNEPVTEADERAPLGVVGDGVGGERGAWHRECGLRMILGSVGHLERRCSCFRPNESKEESCDDDEPAGDPPGMTRREAARAAVEIAKRLGKIQRRYQ